MKELNEKQFNAIFEAEKINTNYATSLKNQLKIALRSKSREIQELKELIVELDTAGVQEAKNIRGALIDLGVWS